MHAQGFRARRQCVVSLARIWFKWKYTVLTDDNDDDDRAKGCVFVSREVCAPVHVVTYALSVYIYLDLLGNIVLVRARSSASRSSYTYTDTERYRVTHVFTASMCLLEDYAKPSAEFRTDVGFSFTC